MDGREYEIDLTSKNAAALRKAFDVYVTNGRRIGGRRPRGTAAGGSSRAKGDLDTKAVPEWANKNGHKVSERGRIPTSLIDAYQAAH